MSIAMIQFLELDNYLNENFNNMTQEEYEIIVAKLEEIKNIIIGE